MAVQLCGSICHEAAGQGLSAAVYDVEAVGKALGEKQEKDSSLSSAFPAEFSREITFTSYPGNTDFKAYKSKKKHTKMNVSRSILALTWKLSIMKRSCSK